MTARRILTALLLALPLLGVSPADARPMVKSGPQQMAYNMVTRNVQNPVEQETDYPFPADETEWVLNPLRPDCAWDVDDDWQAIAQGSVGAGQTFAATECTIASPTSYYRTINGLTAWWSTSPGWYGVQVRADIGTLNVSVCYQPQGRCFAAPPIYDAPNKSWLYNSCTHAAYTPDDPTLATIPGSQGGVGVVQQVTTSIANPTAHTARNVTSSIGAVGAPFYVGGSGGCVKDAPVHADYPFTWTP